MNDHKNSLTPDEWVCVLLVSLMSASIGTATAFGGYLFWTWIFK